MIAEIEIPQAEIDAELLRSGDRDAIAAAGRIRARKASQIAAEKRIQDGLPPESPWRIDPSELEIDAEMERCASSREDGRAMAAKRLAADAKRLASASRDTAKEINEALAVADEARRNADELLAERQAALDALETQIYNYGALRLKIQNIRTLTLDKKAEKILAEQVCNFFVAKLNDASPSNVSGFEVFANDLTWRSAISPHIAEIVAPMEKNCAELAKSIRAAAADSKIDLTVFLKTILAETHRHTNAKLADANLY